MSDNNPDYIFIDSIHWFLQPKRFKIELDRDRNGIGFRVNPNQISCFTGTPNDHYFDGAVTPEALVAILFLFHNKHLDSILQTSLTPNPAVSSPAIPAAATFPFPPPTSDSGLTRNQLEYIKATAAHETSQSAQRAEASPRIKAKHVDSIGERLKNLLELEHDTQRQLDMLRKGINPITHIKHERLKLEAFITSTLNRD